MSYAGFTRQWMRQINPMKKRNLGLPQSTILTAAECGNAAVRSQASLKREGEALTSAARGTGARLRHRGNTTATVKGTWEMNNATIIPAAPGFELLHFLAGYLTECLRQGTWILYAKSGTAGTPALSPQP